MKKIFLALLGLGLIVYFQSLFNGFVFDDGAQIVGNSILYGFDKIPSILFYTWGVYYKPVFYLVLNFILSSFGANPFPFHLFQLLLHTTNAFLLYLLFSKFLKKNISFILAVIFLIHPAISEAVLYISALNDVLYSFFGLVALNVIVWERKLKYKDVVVFIFLALSLLSKETGIAFLIIALLYVFLFDRAKIRKYLFTTTVLLGIYSFIRFFILHIYFLNPLFKPVWTYDADIHTRFISMPKIIFQYLTLFIWPQRLQTVQLWWVRSITFSNFYLPLASVILFFTVVFSYCLYAVSKLKDKSYPYTFFLSFILIGFLLHLQIITLDMTFAERWFYLPLMGILGTLGFVINKIDLKGKKLKTFYLICTLIVIFLSVRTFVRSFDWHDVETLAIHDFLEGDRTNPGSYLALAGFYMEEKQYLKASELYHQVQKIDSSNESVDRAMAFIENFNKNPKNAEEILKNSPKNNLPTRLDYGYLLMSSDPKKAVVFLKDSLRYFPQSFEMYLLLGVSEYKSGNKSDAIKYVQDSAALNPARATEYKIIIDKMKNSKPLNVHFNFTL